MFDNIKLNGPAENALSTLQDTVLSPMEEALFKTWTKANGVDKPDDPNDHVDYRGVYRITEGKILPNGELKRMADKMNSDSLLQKVLQERMNDRIMKAAGSKEDMEKDKFKAERQDVTHGQKMEMEGMKLKSMPHQVQMKKHDVKGKELDIEKTHAGNEGKKIDFMKSLFQPAGEKNATGSKTSSTE